MRTRATHLVCAAICALGMAVILPAYADESALASKIKARLAAQFYSSSSHILVRTDAEGTVWLSGTAPTSDACSLAADVAKNTDGVTAVHNDIHVR